MVNSRGASCLALFCILIFCEAVAAQVDSSFVETFASQNRVNGGLRYRDNSVSFSVGDREDLKLINQGLDLRIGGRYKWLGYTFSIPISDLGTGSDLGNAKSLGVNLQLYRDKFYLNANLRRTTGFERQRAGEPTTFREDIKFFNGLLYGFRILNSRRYSLQSSFRLRGRQLKSSGSLLLGGVINRQILNTDSLSLPTNSEGIVNINRYSQSKLGIGIGYAHTFVRHTFFLSPLLLIGPEIRIIDYDAIAGGGREIEKLRVSPRIRGRLAVGYNGRQNYVSINGSYLPSIDATENLDTRIDLTIIELIVGHRFNIDK